MSAPGAFEDHCTLGASQLAGVEPFALKLAGAGAVTTWSLGCSSIAGAAEQGGGLTVSVTSSVVVPPLALVKVASNLVPDSAVAVGGVV